MLTRATTDPPPPFTSRLLTAHGKTPLHCAVNGTAPHGPSTAQAPPLDPGDNDHDDDAFLTQFPATFVVEEDLRVPRSGTAFDISLLETELDPKRLHGMTHLLWLAGRPVPPRPLHHQILLGREVVLSERINVHLVWGQGRIFVKPIPRYLLNPDFWTEHLTCRCPAPKASEEAASCTCKRPRLRQCALGLLLHYAALVAHESDFHIAQSKNLLPLDVSWRTWHRFVRELLAHRDPAALYADVAERFVYGELRLNRLNLVQLMRRGPLSGGFLAMWNSYGSFYRENSAIIIGATAWILLILSAMQVGLGTERLGGDGAFQAASFGFTVFSILGPMAALAMVFVFVGAALLHNMLRTRRFEAARVTKLGRTWRDGGRKYATGEKGLTWGL